MTGGISEILNINDFENLEKQNLWKIILHACQKNSISFCWDKSFDNISSKNDYGKTSILICSYKYK